MQITRIAKLAIYPRFKKLEGARYTHMRHLQFTQHWTKQLYFMKQKLDIEANRAVRVAQASGRNLAIEDPKLLANLKLKGRIALWAKSYFGNRVSVLAEELGVFVVNVFPAYTSRTCAKCLHCDGQSRVKSVFKCTACQTRTHADINAARVVKISAERVTAPKGSGNVRKYRSGPVRKRSPRARCVS